MKNCKEQSLQHLYADNSAEDILKSLIECGTITEADTIQIIMDKKRKEIIEAHKKNHSIWEWRGKWITCVKDANGKKAIRRRNSLEELADFLIDYYDSCAERIFIKDVFERWSKDKLEYGDLQKQSYDRYVGNYKRFFPPNCELCKTPIGCIKALQIEKHVREAIKKGNLTRKAYSGMITILIGVFKRARKEGLTDLSIVQVIDEMEIPRKAFKAVNRSEENEVFNESEIPVIVSYLANNPDSWNLALLLQFQTGMRIGEIAALRWENVSEDCIRVRATEVKYVDESGKWRVHIQEHTKTDAGYRDIILPPQAKDTLKAIRKINPFGEFMFMNKGKRIRGTSFEKRLGIVCDKVGLNHRSTHKIRKTYGTTLLDARVDDALVAKQMGHKDISTTRQLYYFCNASDDSRRKQVANAIYY